MPRTATFTLVLITAFLLALAGCDQQVGLTQQGMSDDDDWGDDDDMDFSEDVPEECQDELEAADSCWESAETDAEFDACMELEDALMECWDEVEPFEVPQECQDELEAADACWDAAETDEELDACMELEDALMECIDGTGAE